MISGSTWIALFIFFFYITIFIIIIVIIVYFPDDIFNLYYYHFNHGNLLSHCTICSQNVHIQ